MWPSGSNAWLKEWPADRWDALARLLGSKGFEVYLTGGPADAPRNDAFLRAHPQCPAISLAGRTSLAGLAWLFSRATAVVSVNTGTMHLAALAGAPTVGLHGPTNPLRWGRWGVMCAHFCRTRGHTPTSTWALNTHGLTLPVLIRCRWKMWWMPCTAFRFLGQIAVKIPSCGLLVGRWPCAGGQKNERGRDC
jgi:ADP-heptose:LPS heptosyltransferase